MGDFKLDMWFLFKKNAYAKKIDILNSYLTNI